MHTGIIDVMPHYFFGEAAKITEGAMLTQGMPLCITMQFQKQEGS